MASMTKEQEETVEIALMNISSQFDAAISNIEMAFLILPVDEITNRESIAAIITSVQDRLATLIGG